MEIYYLIYLSVAANKFGLDEKELDELLDSCRATNEKLGITGALLYIDGDFIQMIEGDEENVKELYLKIVRDSRHSSILKLTEGWREKRLFSEWRMGFKKMSKADFDTPNGYIDIRDALTDQSEMSDPNHPAIKLMSSFYEIHSLKL